MRLIAATDRMWGIGKCGKLLFNIKEDMDFFKETTTGKVVVMGRKTLESLPNGEFLKNRINLVISNKMLCGKDSNGNVIGNIDLIREEIKHYNTDDVYIIGGGEVYNTFMSDCDTAYITSVEKYCESHTFINNLAFEGFIRHSYIKSGKDNGVKFSINKWVKNPNKYYKAVLWIYNSRTDMNIFACTYDCNIWYDVFSDLPVEFDYETRELLFKYSNKLFFPNNLIDDTVAGCDLFRSSSTINDYDYSIGYPIIIKFAAFSNKSRLDTRKTYADAVRSFYKS
jgi:dihydrofolate reductase